MTFGEVLRREREARGLTRDQLADASGVTFGSIHGYEIGRRAPSFANVVKLAGALGLTCEAFAGCSDIQDGPPGADAMSPAGPPARKPRGRSKKKKPPDSIPDPGDAAPDPAYEPPPPEATPEPPPLSQGEARGSRRRVPAAAPPPEPPPPPAAPAAETGHAGHLKKAETPPVPVPVAPPRTPPPAAWTPPKPPPAPPKKPRAWGT